MKVLQEDEDWTEKGRRLGFLTFCSFCRVSSILRWSSSRRRFWSASRVCRAAAAKHKMYYWIEKKESQKHCPQKFWSNGSMQCLPMVPAFRCCAEMLLLLALFGLSSSPENSECLKYCLHEYQDSFVTEIAGKKQNSILCELPPERDSKVDYYSKYLQKVIQKYIIPKITSRERLKGWLEEAFPSPHLLHWLHAENQIS